MLDGLRVVEVIDRQFVVWHVRLPLVSAGGAFYGLVIGIRRGRNQAPNRKDTTLSQPHDPHMPPFSPLMNVQPGPVTSACAKTPDGTIIIHFEHSTGSTSLPVPLEVAKNLIAQLQEVTGGLVVPSPVIPGPR